MSNIELIAELTDICTRQAEIIKAQASALAQVGAVVMAEERADVERTLTALIGHDEMPDDVQAEAHRLHKHEGSP